MRFQFDRTNAIKILRGAAIAGGGAVLTYLATWVSETDFGPWTATVAALAAVLINAGREFLKTNGGDDANAADSAVTE